MTITIASLTTNVATSATYVVTGDGVLDDIMETVNAHLDAQFKLGRITGTDYATVYLGAMQAAVTQAVQYALGQEKTNAEVALLNQKEVTEFVQTGLSVSITAATAIVEGAADINGSLVFTANTVGPLGNDLIVTLNDAGTAAVVVSGNTITITPATGSNTATAVIAQVAANAAASQLITATASGNGSTEPGVAVALSLTGGSEAHTDSTQGRQQNLYTEQAKGFQWNADQKYLKTLLDAWSINISTAGVAATGVTAINETGTGNINTQITNAEPT